MKFTLFKKIIITTCLVSTLIFTLVVPCFASSYGGKTGVLQPMFFPSDIIVSESGSDSGVSLTSDISLLFSPGVNANAAFEYFVNDGSEAITEISFTGSASSTDTSLLSGYGISYIRGKVDATLFHGDLSTVFTNPILSFLFPDIYVPYNLIQNNSAKLNWLSNWQYLIYDYNDDTIEPANANVSFWVTYIQKVDNNYTPKSLYISSDISYSLVNSSQEIGAFIYDSLNSRLSASDKLGGVVISDLAVNVGVVDSLSQVMMWGENKYVFPSSAGFRYAEQQWKAYRNVTINNVVNNDTVVGSITNGLRDIWRLELFGEFTIGNLFTAIVGLSCFIWILKIFAGG